MRLPWDIARTAACALLLVFAASGDAIAQSSSHAKGLYDAVCGGHCAVTVYAGKYLETGLDHALGIDGFTAPSDYDFDSNGLVAGAFSRRLASLGGVIDIEAELGVGQRFGKMDEAEGWVALYLRWTALPWNHLIRTTVAVSTGLNYASDVNAIEETRGGVAGGSRLLHFLSPEVTFALPEAPQWEFTTRYHHRSGGGDFLLGDTWLFKGVDGGAQFLSAGLRYRF